MLPEKRIILLIYIFVLCFIYYIHAAADFGSLLQCGEENTVGDIFSSRWTFKFHCKDGDVCVNQTCWHCNSASANANPSVANGCQVTKSVIDRCNAKPNASADDCDKNYLMNKFCGFAFRRADNYTYYLNCEGGGDCMEPGNCTNPVGKVLLTKCNKPDQWVTNGQCQGIKCPVDIECVNIDMSTAGGGVGQQHHQMKFSIFYGPLIGFLITTIFSENIPKICII